MAVDTTQATSTDRVKIYINGVQITSFGTAVYPTQNLANQINVASRVHNIGKLDYYALYLDAYLTDVYFIDGQQLTVSSFGATDATTGQWSPARYTGTYGTNGFHLTFANATSTTTLGYDTSGNSNNWTTNNISLTAGSTYDSMNDVPVAYSATAANYAVMNPLVPSTGTNSQGNLSVSTASVNASPATIFANTGKWYWEVVWVSGGNYRIGVCNSTGAGQDLGGSANGWAKINSPPRVYNNGSAPSYGTDGSVGDTFMVALDLDAGKIWYGINGTWQASGSPSTGANPSQTFTANQTMSPAVASGTGTLVYNLNFGQQPFTYTPPSGYNALNTYNLPTPTIAQGNKYMDATLYTGNGTSQTITNAGLFQPDFVWAKGRSGATSNILVNAVTGANQFLLTDATQAEATSSALVSAFTSSGFSIGSSTSINNSSSTYVGWQWKANGSGSSNTNGSITSTVSASTTAGFSIVNWTPSAGNDTVGHGLGVAPSMIIAKPRTIATFWPVYHSALGPTKVIGLNVTDAQSTGATSWNNTSPTSTVFSTASWFSNSGATIAYCFAPIAGFSAFGSWTGNGSATGPFIYCGFQPRFILSKRTDTGGNNWMIIDTARNPYNVTGSELYPSSNNNELTGYSDFNVTSNGFQIAATYSYINASGGTYIYAAFASNPFAYSNAF